MKYHLARKVKASEVHRKKLADERDYILYELKKRFKEMKLRAPKRPRNEDGTKLEPELPADITKITDEELGRVHGAFALMAQYATFQLALRAVEHAIAKRAEILLRARARLEKEGTVHDKSAKVEVDSRVKAISLQTLIGHGEESLTQAVLDGYLIGRDVSSREMSRRMNLAQHDRT